MHIAALGDVMLDVIVDAPDGLHDDDDVKAQIDVTAGGQAANVAAWAASLGARATVIGPRGQATTALFVDDQLSAAGVGMIAVDVPVTGTVVSIVTDKSRTLASDAGDPGWVGRLDPHRLPIDLDWLHVSGYPLWRSPDPRPLLAFVEAARRNGASISIDLASASMLTAYGIDTVWSVLNELAPRLVFANASEWDAVRARLVRRRVRRGCQGWCRRCRDSGERRDHGARRDADGRGRPDRRRRRAGRGLSRRCHPARAGLRRAMRLPARRPAARPGTATGPPSLRQHGLMTRRSGAPPRR